MPQPPDPAAWGVLPRYRAATGELREVAAGVVARVLEGMGAGRERPESGQAIRFIAAGEAVRGEVELEGGGRLRPGRPVPPGYHRLGDRLLVASPRSCVLPNGRQWGLAAQLYAVRSRRSWGIGDLGDLRRLGASARRLGAGFMLLNPLHAAAPVSAQEPSPYHPSSRRFRNPLYIRIEDVPGAAGADLGRLARAAAELNSQRRIDRDAVYRLKSQALERLWQAFPADPAFERFRNEQGSALRDFATWCTLAERHGAAWHAWPEQLRHPRSAAVARFAAGNDRRVRYHEWLQWLLETQLGAAAAALPLIADLAVGFDPEGADAWLYQDVLADRFRVGAPPDIFVPQGQDWGLPPYDPWKLRAAAYAPFIETLRAGFRHAGGLRIDHVMGLFRLWWVERGREPAEGAYVRYPARELLDIVALESHRARAYVIGEDLGTVEAATRRELARRRILGSRVFWFEQRPPERYPELALASVTTHDLPTLAGVWTGRDSEVLRGIGQEPFAENERRQRRRIARAAGVSPKAPVEEAAVGVYSALARAPSLLVAVTLEDLLGVPERPNYPGTGPHEWPDWSLALPEPLESIQRSATTRRLAAVLNRAQD